MQFFPIFCNFSQFFPKKLNKFRKKFNKFSQFSPFFSIFLNFSEFSSIFRKKLKKVKTLFFLIFSNISKKHKNQTLRPTVWTLCLWHTVCAHVTLPICAYTKVLRTLLMAHGPLYAIGPQVATNSLCLHAH